jgi:hypothetical protein
LARVDKEKREFREVAQWDYGGRFSVVFSFEKDGFAAG